VTSGRQRVGIRASGLVAAVVLAVGLTLSAAVGAQAALPSVGQTDALPAAENPGQPGQPVDPQTEAQNYSKIQERQAIYDTPAYQAKLTTVSAQNAANAAAIQTADPERQFADNLCANQGNGCAGDIRLNDWKANGYGLVEPILYTARSGATISGHVWATRTGPATRPGIVITNGSVQANEQLYWFAAQALAKDGYIVMTWDPQGQGQSDTPGAGVDAMEGVPAQKDGRPFYDGTEDAVNFFLSSKAKPYEPIPSCNSGTSHADKQNRRVAAGFDSAYDPFFSMIDTSEIGLAGHSYGAAGVSYIAQFDPRVKAVVAWDNLGPPDPNSSAPVGETGCFDPTQRTAAPVAKPGLGMSADYYIPPEPNTTVPEPLAKSTESLAYTKAGVDSGQIVIRGGSHFDFDWIPNQAFGATLRGADEITWYTNAWFDKYLKHSSTADARLMTNRWRTDSAEAVVDPNGDGNDFSFYYRSRLDIHRSDGIVFDCENLRAGCPGLTTNDACTGEYTYLALDTSPDAASDTSAGCKVAAVSSSAPPSGQSAGSGAGAGSGSSSSGSGQISQVPSGGVDTGGGSTSGIQHTGEFTLGGLALLAAGGVSVVAVRSRRRVSHSG